MPNVARLFTTLLLLCLGSTLLAQASTGNRVTILNDAFSNRADLQQDWGYAALIEFEGKRILFDTGDNIAVFQKNVEALHVDLSHLDMVIVTHSHGDHTSGLRYVLARNPHVPLYVPDDPYFTGTTLPPAFLTTDARPELPAEMRYFNGNGPQAGRKGWSAWTDTHMTAVRDNLTIAPHIRLVSAVSDKPAFKGLREISLVLETPHGLAIFVGCSHPGIERIMAEATHDAPGVPVELLAGGLHLLQDTPEQVDATLTTLEQTYRVQTLAIGHCSGELTFLEARRRWAQQYRYAGLGTVITF